MVIESGWLSESTDEQYWMWSPQAVFPSIIFFLPLHTMDMSDAMDADSIIVYNITRVISNDNRGCNRLHETTIFIYSFIWKIYIAPLKKPTKRHFPVQPLWYRSVLSIMLNKSLVAMESI